MNKLQQWNKRRREKVLNNWRKTKEKGQGRFVLSYLMIMTTLFIVSLIVSAYFFDLHLFTGKNLKLLMFSLILNTVIPIVIYRISDYELSPKLKK